MKTSRILTIVLLLFIPFISCDKDKDENNTTLGGEQSPMGDVGTSYTAEDDDFNGVSELQAIVTDQEDGISTYSGSAIVTNPLFRNVLSNVPEITFKGDTAIATDVKIKQSTEGIQLLSGPTPGILVKYDAEVGDTYPIGNGDHERKVVSKSELEDYFYGWYMIKAIEVEESTSQYKSSGISSVTYWMNHRYGLVGISFCFDDDSYIHFTVFSSAEN